MIARDAFNGTLLWKRPIAEWNTQLWPLKSGPNQLPRRLVAVGDRVYVTLGHRRPLAALDAATGKTVRTYAGTDHTDEVLDSDGDALPAGRPRSQPWKTYRPKFTLRLGQYQSRQQRVGLGPGRTVDHGDRGGVGPRALEAGAPRGPLDAGRRPRSRCTSTTARRSSA